MNKITSKGLLFAVLTAVTSTPLLALPQGYSVTKIEVPGAVMFARALNENGQVAGGTRTGHAFVWSDGASQVFDGYSDAYGLNDLGQVSGELSSRAVVWKDGGTTELNSYCPSIGDNIAIDINNSGQVMLRLSLHPYLLTGGQAIDLDPTHILSQYYGDYINNKGEVAMYGYSDGQAQAVFWKNNTRTDLYAWGCETVFGINDAGQVIGDSVYGQGYIWQNGNMSYLGDHTRAYGINELGTVVGISNHRASIWENGVQADLNTLISPSLGITLSEAIDTNSRGQVLASVQFGEYYLLTPVPEPSSILALLSGIAGFAALTPRMRRRRSE